MKTELQKIAEDMEKRSVTLRLVVTGTEEDGESGRVCVQPPKFAEPFRHVEVCVEQLRKGETMELELKYQMSMGGRYVFYTWVKGNELATLNRAVVSFKGAGIYSGNTHSHSTYSDGKSTLEENRRVMMENGHSFIYATDHNTTAHHAELKEYEAKGIEENFLHIPGWEFTTPYGHSIAYRTDEVYDKEKIPERGDLEAWQEYMDVQNGKNAIVYICHPYEAPKYEYGENVLKEIQGAQGVEAWNGYNFHALAYQNRKNFEVWDKLNRRGGQHYVGSCVSDAHTAIGQSSPFMKGYLPELSREAVEGWLTGGGFFGSNGPELDFRIGAAGMGGTCHVNGAAGMGEDGHVADAANSQKVLMTVDAFDPLGDIEAVNVYRGFVDGEYLEKPNTKKVFEFYPMGENEKRRFVKDMYIDVKPGEFYRVEMITGLGVVAYMSNHAKVEKGFAFTNPIWIEK